MIQKEPIHGAPFYLPYLKTFQTGSNPQLLGIDTGDTANKPYGKVMAVVLHKVATEKVTKVFDNKIANSTVVKMSMDKRRQ
jgi:hypothetical protein